MSNKRSNNMNLPVTVYFMSSHLTGQLWINYTLKAHHFFLFFPFMILKYILHFYTHIFSSLIFHIVMYCQSWVDFCTEPKIQKSNCKWFSSRKQQYQIHISWARARCGKKYHIYLKCKPKFKDEILHKSSHHDYNTNACTNK